MAIGKLRAALLASAALTALCLPPAQPARAGPDWCTSDLNTSTAICSGDQSAGILEYNRYFLTVRNLSGDIKPAAGDVGVLLLNIPPGAITTEPGLYSIITTGDGAYGIYAKVVLHSIRVTNNLRITTSGARSDAIKATVFVGDGPAEVINSADLTTTGDDSRGIFVEMGPNGLSPVENTNANVVNHGAITTGGARSHAIVASALVGDATITNDARITVAGDDAYGLFANAGGNVARVVNGGPIMMTGQANRAIVARGNGSGDVQNDGPLSLDGASSYGIDARVAGPVLVTSTADITATGSGSFGITAFSISQGKATIVNSGDISTSGGASRGLWASAANGDAYVKNDGIISNTGPGESLGIGAFASIGLVTVKNYGAVTTEGGHAVMATNFYGDIDITNDASLTAGRDGIYAAVFTSGKATIASRGDIAGVTGGINVRTTAAEISISSVGDVETSGASDADAISGYAYGSSVLIDSAGSVTTVGSGSVAIRAEAIYGDAEIVSTGALGTRGEKAYGIEARGQDVTVDNNATIVTEGGYANGIQVMATGRAHVDNRVAITTSGDNGIAMAVRGDYGVELTNSAALSTGGDFATAIFASVIEGDANVTNSGVISVTGSGALFPAYGIVATTITGSAKVDNSGAVSVAGGDAIFASTDVGDVNITNGAPLTAGGFGIVGRAYNTGSVNIVTRGDVTAGQRGVEAYTRFGEISIESHGNIESLRGDGIVAAASELGSVTIRSTGNITVVGDGISAATRQSTAAHSATIVSEGDIAAVGDYARAIHLAAYGQGLATIASVGGLSAVGRYSSGIAAEAHDGVALKVDNQGDVQVVGTGAYGMRLESAGGNIDLISRGTITAEGGFNYGIGVDSGGADAAVVSKGDIRILGQYGRGIVANGVNARADSSGNLLLDGNGAVGILASAYVQSASGVPGMARITSAGLVTMTGADAVALKAESLFGDTEIIVADGTVSGGSGQGAGVELSAARTARLENRGIIRSLNDRAIVNDPGSGPATVDNLNTIIGSISLNDGEDSLANRGMFEVRGDSDFGTGTDDMVNSGILRVSDSSGADQVTILGLESFTNGSTGLITMVDGRTGDRLTLSALTAFNGGGVIAFDAALAGSGSPADLLTVSGVVSGTTLVAVNNVARAPGVRGADDIFVIDQGSRPRGDEFRLSAGPISAGFFYYDLRPDDDGSTRWELYESGTNWQAIDALGAVMTGLQNIWHAGVSAWHQRMGDLVSLAMVPQLTPAADFPEGPTFPRMRGGLWMRGFGENADYDPPSAADFHQSIAATQGGVDGIAKGPLGGDSVIAGLLGAYVHSDLDLEHMPDRVVYEGGSIGGYLTYLNGGFHADLLVKADLLTVTYRQHALSGEFDARSIGGSFELGYEFDIGYGFYLNPLGQLAYVASEIDDGSLGESVPISFADGDSLRSRAGLRAGYRAALANATIEPYLDAHFLHEFAGGNRGAVFGYLGARNELDSWGTVGGGIQVNAARFTAFATLQSFVGGEIDGFAGQGGLRWSF